MTDQDTLNKLFEAALKEPEKTAAPRSKFTAHPAAIASAGGGATTIATPTRTASAFKQAEPKAAEPKAAEQSPVSEADTNTQESEESSDESPAKSKGSKAKLIATLLVILCVIGGGVWYFFLR